jgi:hypothetical protein
LCVAGPRVSLEQQFQRKVLNTDGSESGEFVINEEIIASLDYIVACSQWAGIQDCREQANYFRHRAGFYKHYDGRDGKRDWRADLLECLHAWQMRFPDVVQKRSISMEGPVQKDLADAAGGAATGDPVPAEWL